MNRGQLPHCDCCHPTRVDSPRRVSGRQIAEPPHQPSRRRRQPSAHQDKSGRPAADTTPPQPADRPRSRRRAHDTARAPPLDATVPPQISRKPRWSPRCACRKARHDCRSRCGAGGKPASASTLRTNVAETAMPSLRSSPTIRSSPSSSSRGRADESAPAPRDRSADGLVAGEGMSSGGRPAGDASAAGSPAAPGKRSTAARQLPTQRRE
jgi:hypothetical protein